MALNCTPKLHLNLDVAPNIKIVCYIKYGVLDFRRQLFTSLA